MTKYIIPIVTLQSKNTHIQTVIITNYNMHYYCNHVELLLKCTITHCNKQTVTQNNYTRKFTKPQHHKEDSTPRKIPTTDVTPKPQDKTETKQLQNQQ